MLILLRHGQTAANARGLLLGRTDVPLTDLGLRQAEAARTALPDVDRVVSSPLLRARQSAAAAAPGCETVLDDRWIEIDYGDYEELSMTEVPSDVRERWRGDVTFRPPGGESLAEVGDRVRCALSDLAAEASESTVLVVSHVSPIKAALAWALGVGDEVAWRLYLSVASISRVAVAVGAAPSVVAVNETAHLAGIA